VTHLLEFDDVSVTYETAGGEVPAVRGVSLSVAAGEVVGVAGESGCGKSTLAATILRLQPSSARVTGRILFEGEDVQTMKWGSLRALRWAGASMVFQGALHSLNPVQRVGAQISEPISLHEPDLSPKVVETRVGELLEQVGLPRQRARAYPHQLSGGQRQRVGVARALAANPPVLLMDEPFGAVDPVVRGRLQDEFRRLQDELGKTVVLVTHDIDEAIRMGDRVAVFAAGGRLAQYATPGELLAHPADDQVADFVGSGGSAPSR
jgi:peptide/nickel transport system ATP-binding protein